MSEKKHLGTISILVKDRQSHAQDVQKILTDNGHLIMARLGVNVQRSCVENCNGIITVAVEGTADEIRGLAEKFDDFYGVVAKSHILTD
jgi:metal-responsive CopG/Arc/MetJ family transcriptional regulator